jgi:tRNA nucleotidyltransferase (CCA-adding enzyme)
MVAEGMLEELPKERIFEEIKKLLLRAKRPSAGWVLIKDLGVLRDFYVLNTLSEDQWHLLLRRVDMMSILKPSEEAKAIILMLSALCLPCSEDQVATFLEILSDEVKLREEVIPLVVHHEAIDHIYRANPKDRDTLLRRLATKVRIRDLVTIARADFWARHEQNIEYKAGEWVLQRAAKLNVLDSSLPPFLQGRDLISHFGLKPSPVFKDILEKVYEMQLKGIIHSREEALKYVQRELL